MDSEQNQRDYKSYTSESPTSSSNHSETLHMFPPKQKRARSRRGYFHGPRPDLTTFTRIPEFSGCSKDKDRVHTLFQSNQQFSPESEASCGNYFCGDGGVHLDLGRKDDSSSVSLENSCGFQSFSQDIRRTNMEYQKKSKHETCTQYHRSKEVRHSIHPFPSFGKFRKEAESEDNFLVSAVKLGTHVFKACWELVTVFFSEDVKSNEDIVKFNGYAIRTSGDALALDSMQFNVNGRKFRLQVKLTSALSDGSEPEVIFEDRKWVMTFGSSDEGFIEVSVPLGINTAQIEYEGPVDGLIIIESP